MSEQPEERMHIFSFEHCWIVQALDRFEAMALAPISSYQEYRMPVELGRRVLADYGPVEAVLIRIVITLSDEGRKRRWRSDFVSYTMRTWTKSHL